jgi:Transposase DDE domain
MLSMIEFIIAVYCLVDDAYRAFLQCERGGKPLRRRGPAPKLSDSEVITMLIVGEFLGFDTDEDIHRYFRQHWGTLFRKIPDRTTFLRQAANLWVVIAHIQHALARHLGAFDDDCHIIDGLPMTVANINRAKRTKSFRGEATVGYCASKKHYFYGFHGTLLISLSGIITGFTVTAANVDERDAAWDVLDEVMGLLLGDKGYISRFFQSLLQERGVRLWTPVRSNMEPTTGPATTSILMNTRRLIETIVGQLSERLHIERIRARDRWHLTERVGRKILAHTIGMAFLKAAGIHTLELDRLLAA